ncbi:MAG: 2-dehydropantoate 2-reductase [Clostridiales Family XIII bacterium]|nr:2-dehydropantoate 2-reductase [Clostridiales Family XIII bacterium]
MDIAIIGTGAIGGYYGARLAHSGNDVHFLLHSDFEYVKEHGLTVDSHFGDFSLPKPKIYANTREMPPCDLVCVAVKATANAVIFPQLAGVVKAGGAILLLQNGFGYEPQLAALYPKQSILAGLCFICSYRDGPGRVRHTDYGKLSLAAMDNDGDALARISELFERAGVETEVKADLTEARIRKLMWNIPYNGMSVIADCRTDALVKNPAMRSATCAVMDEILQAAKAVGAAIEPSFADEMVRLTDEMVPYDPSMRLDFLAGRPLEIEAIYGNFIDYAEQRGYEMRFAKMMKWQLEYLETRFR